MLPIRRSRASEIAPNANKILGLVYPTPCGKLTLQWAMALAIAFACARSSRKHSLVEPRDSPVTTLPGSVLPSQDNYANPKSMLRGLGYSHTPGCLGAVDDKVDVARWYEAAARACHPGSKRQGAIVSEMTNRETPLIFDIPSEIKSSCWTAFVVVDRVISPLLVDLVEQDGTSQRIGEVIAARSAIPRLGPFCPLRGDFYQLRIQPSVAGSVRISLAWYAFD